MESVPRDQGRRGDIALCTVPSTALCEFRHLRDVDKETVPVKASESLCKHWSLSQAFQEHISCPSNLTFYCIFKWQAALGVEQVCVSPFFPMFHVPGRSISVSLHCLLR